jgi:hypothetical protein
LNKNDTDFPCFGANTSDACYLCSSAPVVLGVTVDADITPTLLGAPFMTVANAWRYQTSLLQLQLCNPHKSIT